MAWSVIISRNGRELPHLTMAFTTEQEARDHALRINCKPFQPLFARAQEQLPTELTPAGEQFVIPGCERNASTKAKQLGLFG